MCLPGVELAALAGSHDVGGVGDYGGLVEPLPKCIAHEGARRGVVTVDSSVDVPDQLLALGDGDAMLQNARGAMYSSSSTKTKDLALLAIRRA